MTKVRAIIVDDEQAARNVLCQLLQLECPFVEVIAKCKDVPEVVAAIKELQPDVIFLDIQMPNYAGYEIINYFDEINFEIVFITAYNQYAIKAFELNAVDYLVKPIQRKRLLQAVNKLQEKIEVKKTLEQYRLLKQSMQSKTIGHLVITELGKQNIIKLEDIIAIEASGAYSKIYIKGKESLTATKNIKQFESLLPENGTFFRSHKSWIINKEHIQRYYKMKLELQLSENIISKLSRYKKDEFELMFK